MTVYAVIPVKDSDKMRSLLNSTFKEDNSVKELPNKNAFMVSFNGTSSEFSKKLNLSGNEEGQSKDFRPCEGILFPIGAFGGYADADIWEWIKSKI